MQSKIKALHQPETKERNSVEVIFKIPTNWWSSCSSFGAQEKRSKLDLIRLNPIDSKKNILPMPKDWNISEGDYIAGADENYQRLKSSREIKISKERLYLTVGILIVCLVIILFSTMIASL